MLSGTILYQSTNIQWVFLPEVQSVQREACSDSIGSVRYNRNVYDGDDVVRIAVGTATANSTVLAKEADK